MKQLKKLSMAVMMSVIVFCLFYFNLLSRYSFISAFIDVYTIGLVYPQCEFQGDELKQLNSISTEMGFQVIYVDCDLFYTRGMNQYYGIMSSKIEAENGPNWLIEMHENRKN
jgi:hypothetical protein